MDLSSTDKTSHAVTKMKQLSINGIPVTETELIPSKSPSISQLRSTSDNLKPSDRTQTLVTDMTTIRSISNLDSTHDFIEESKQFHHSKLVGIMLYIPLIMFILFLMLLSCFYGVGQLYSISLTNFWCDDKYSSYTLEQIYQINRKNNNAQGSQHTCLATDAIADYDKLFAIDPSVTYASEWDSNNQTRNYIYCIFYQIVCLAFFYVLISPLCNFMTTHALLKRNSDKPDRSKSNKQQTEQSKEQQKKDTSKTSQSVFLFLDLCFNTIKGGAMSCLHTWQRISSVDTPSWVAIKVTSELLEIGVQILVLFQYGGTSLTEIIFGNDGSSSQTSQLPVYVVAFAFIIMINGLITGIFWFLYSMFPSKVYGHFFNDMLFIFDGVFDAVYSIYPLIIAGALRNDSDSSMSEFMNKIGILQHSTWVGFIGAAMPMLLLVKKCDSAMKRVKHIMTGQHIGDEYTTHVSDLELYKLHKKMSADTTAQSSADHSRKTSLHLKAATVSVDDDGDGDSNGDGNEMNDINENEAQDITNELPPGETTMSARVQVVAADSNDHDMSLEERITNSKLSHGMKTTVVNEKGAKITKKLFISHRKLLERQISREFAKKSSRLYVKQRHRKRRMTNNCKRIMLACFSLVVIGVSLLVGLSVIIDTYNAQSYCNSFEIDTINHGHDDDGNSELLLYKKNCQTKVYRLFANYPCDCRFFQITREETDDNNSTLCQIANSDDYYNIGDIIGKVFSKWTMLERIDIRSNGATAVCLPNYMLNITDESFFNSKNLQAFVLQYATISVELDIEWDTSRSTLTWQNTYNDTNYDYDEYVYNQTSELIIQSMKNWNNMRFLSLETVLIENYVESFAIGIGSHMKNMVYLHINFLDILMWPSAWCNMYQTIEYFEVSTHTIETIPDCIGSFTNLKYFKLWAGSTVSVPFSVLFNLPKIKIVAFNWESITWNSLVESFYPNSTNYTFTGYNTNSLTEIYFQANPLCDTFENLTRYAYEKFKYIELIEMIDSHDACTVSCFHDGLEYFCPSFRKGNGVCDSECYTDWCGWDDGDCNQLCNFTQCTIRQDGICNPYCNSTECSWDANDCKRSNFDCPDSCSNYLLADGICETVCLNNTHYPECASYEYENDCIECGGDCENIYILFSLATSRTEYGDDKEAISQQDLCDLEDNGGLAWQELQTAAGQNLSCTNFVNNVEYDPNLNGFIGLYEFILVGGEVFFADVNEIWKSFDCSMCLNNASNYYM